MGRIRLAMLVFVVAVLMPARANAMFHLWQIKEVFSNSTGSIQYIELFSTTPGQTFLTNHTLVINDGTDHTFTFPADIGSSSTKHLLIATPGFTNIPGAPTPDYTLPCGPFFNPSATTITINFASGSDVESFAGTTLPKDGINSLSDSVLSGSSTATWSSGQNSPTNNAGSTGPATLSTGEKAGTEDACNDGMFCNGPETCSAGACSGTKPCAKACIEASDTCVECVDASTCNDSNPCTDDSCNAGNACEHVAHTGSCDDGLFCNGADNCSGTTCMHAGDPCSGANCNEGPDTCGNCTGPADCDEGEPCTLDTCDSGTCHRNNAADGAECDSDSVYCNGVGTCTAAVCGGIAAPCDPATSMCLEAMRACSPLDATPDAPGVDPMDNGDGGGCCQANTTPATFTGPLLVLALGMLVGRRRRRRT